jgi:type IV/VI secretion system ImpK/VasF family protein
MNLLELCEPLFLKICELNRMARLGQSQHFLEARDEIKVLLDEIQQKAAGEVKLAAQAKKLELPLTFFVDSMISSSRLKFAAEWNDNRLAAERYNELAGDDRFFEFLEETINDTSDEAAERLTVFYQCLGLGFVGSLVGQPDQLKAYMSKILPRTKHVMDLDSKARICPDAYNSVDTRDLIEPPASRLVFVLILFLFLCVSTMLALVGMYANATDKMNSAVSEILKHETRR